jgi:hypothetical protein
MYEELITWLDREGRVADVMLQPTYNEHGAYHGIEVVSVDKMEVRSASDILAILADSSVVDATSTDPDVLMIRVQQARSKIAFRSKRAMGNYLIPCADGCLMTYVGSNSHDRAVMQLADQQYVAVSNLSDHFVFLQGDPDAIQTAFSKLQELRATAA